MNADPRRPDKIQRYVPKNNSNGEDLTPDYMNIMGQHPTTANAAGEAIEKHPDSSVSVEPNLQAHSEEVQLDELTVASNAANVIPTSPQYGVAIIPNNATITGSDLTNETVSIPTETLLETTGKSCDEIKDIHSTPSRNDRFKVVKIASLEPFKRGRWKCMDYVDEAPPPNVANANTNKSSQSVGNTAITGGVYLQTQSLPQQQIQQMLLQGGFTNGTQFFPSMPAQLIPQGQYFYPQVANVPNQNVPQQVATSMPAQFINSQPYFTAGVVTNPAGFTLPQGYPNIQYVPIQTQNSAFVPTTQAVQLPSNFQQSQTYAGQSTLSQANLIQNMMNGHAYPQHTEPQVPASNMPNQTAKSVIMNSQPVSTQPQQNHVLQNQPAQSAPVVQTQQYQQSQSGTYHQATPTQQTQSQNANQQNPNMVSSVAPGIAVPQQNPQNFDANNVYTNPQFAMSVNSLVLENSDHTESNETNSVVETVGENPDDLSKSNPVVNAIDNKIEQAMDLVKSHLMYTVREEVEVLKEKIAELMEKIQQLETENNYLRSQIPKNVAPTPTANATFANPVSQPQPSNVAVVNPSPSVMQQTSNSVITNSNVSVGPSTSNNPPSQSQAIPSSSSVQPPNKETSIQ